MTRAILLRHGESVANAHPEAASLPPREGDRLTERGRVQAAAAAGAVAELEPTVLLCSPMRRAAETADVLNRELGLPAHELDYAHELRESRRFGEMAPEEQKLRRWSVWMSAHRDDPDYSWEGGESFNEVRGRVRRLKAELAGRWAGERPLVVTHGIFARFFLFDSLLGDGFGVEQVERLWWARSLNCGISVFEHGERWHPADPDTPGWTCIGWMSRPGEPPPLVGAGR